MAHNKHSVRIGDFKKPEGAVTQQLFCKPRGHRTVLIVTQTPSTVLLKRLPF